MILPIIIIWISAALFVMLFFMAADDRTPEERQIEDEAEIRWLRSLQKSRNYVATRPQADEAMLRETRQLHVTEPQK